MAVHRYLFFVEKEEIIVINHEPEKGKSFSYLTNQGEKKFKITDKFWSWWQDGASYVPGDKVDFCFIWDEMYYILEQNFLSRADRAEESCWTRGVLEEFFKNMLPYTHIELVDGREDILHIDKENVEFMDNTVRTFYTNICIFPPATEKIRNKNVKETEITPFARYFKELLEREKQG